MSVTELANTIPLTSALPRVAASGVLLLPGVPNPGVLGDVRDELGQHPRDGPNQFWYNCAVRKRVVYLWFDRSFTDQQEIRDGMKYALVNDLDGVTVKTNGSDWGRTLDFAAETS
jgi:hypothetical protein